MRRGKVNRKTTAAASGPHHRTGSLLSNGEMQRSLSKHFEHLIKVSGVKGRRIISWAFGPHRENVWATVVRVFPELAVEALAETIKAGGVEINDGYFAFPIPAWVRRLDFFTAPVESFTALLTDGGDPNESDMYGISPIEYAMSRGDAKRAVALIEAGAFFESYGPDGWQRQLVGDMPEVIAAMEAARLRQVTAMAFHEGWTPSRL
jgi:hypothetical protein